MSRPVNLVKVYHGMIKTDQELVLPLFNKQGELLAQKGTMLDEQRAVSILRHGDIYTIRAELVEALKGVSRNSSTEKEKSFRYRFPAVFLQLEDLSKRLAQIYRLEVEDFHKEFNRLLANLEKLIERQREACLAAIVLAQHRDIFHHAIHCAIIADILARTLEWKESERLSLVSAALTMDFVLASDQIDLSKFTDEEKLAHQKLSCYALMAVGVDDKKWLEYVACHHGVYDESEIQETSWGANILIMVDLFCARISAIYGGSSMRPHEVLQFMNRQFLSPMDSLTFDALVSIVGIFPIGSIVVLQNGEVGVVTALTKKLDKPVVHAVYTTEGSQWQTPIVRKTENPNYRIKQVLPVEHFVEFIDIHQFWQ